MKSAKVDGVTVRFRARFVSPYEQYADRIGQRFTVLGPAPLEDYDKEEVGRMWQIRWEDGTVQTAWPEEVERDVMVNGKHYSGQPATAQQSDAGSCCECGGPHECQECDTFDVPMARGPMLSKTETKAEALARFARYAGSTPLPPPGTKGG